MLEYKSKLFQIVPQMVQINPYRYRYRLLTGFSVLLVLILTMLIPHDQRRLHMPEPWSYALAAQNFAQGNWCSFLAA